MSGTDKSVWCYQLGGAVEAVSCQVRSLCPYAPATQCPVLPQRIVRTHGTGIVVPTLRIARLPGAI
eukprot:2953454-Rhodomonas_salina.2